MTSTSTASNYGAWIGRKVVDNNGEKVGKVEAIYNDIDSGQPEWLAITTGLFGTRHSFAPIEGATSSGDDVVLAYSKQQVKDAPNVEADGHLEPNEEDDLYRHYGRSTDTASAPAPERTGDTDDSAMTRSEEQLSVDKRSKEAGRARLVKHVVTEDVNVTVPVQHEEMRIEREPITDANRAAAMDGAEITEAEHEMVLNAEEVEVTKKVVPQERVKLSKETVTEDQQVSESVRKEEIDIEKQ